MTSSRFLRQLIALGCGTILSQSLFASSESLISVAERDTIIKEDLAAAHVMVEICPTVLGSDFNFAEKMKQVSAPFFADLSDKTMTVEKLLADAEYQEVLAQARLDAEETTVEEKKEVCSDLAAL